MTNRSLPASGNAALLLVVVLLAALAGAATNAGAVIPAWTTYRHDAGRSGIDPDSTNPLTPAQVWQTPALDGEVYAQPLVYGARVYVATENDTVYALDAATGAVVWMQHLGTPEPSSVAPCGDISPNIGITSTPVIDPASGRLYAVGAVSDGMHAATVRHELFAVDLATGNPVTGFPVAVDPAYPSGGAPIYQLQRTALGLDGGRVLIGYGGNDGDCPTYWGWLVSAPGDGTSGLTSFQVDHNQGHTEGAIWAAGDGPTIDAAGNVYVATGNGSGNSSSDPDYGDSVVKLNSAASPLDYWAPTNWQSLDQADNDLGSSMPTLLPGGLLFQSGKDGNGYLLNSGALGHVAAPVATASGFCSGGSFGGSVYYPPTSAIYVACTGGLRALTLGSGATPSLTSRSGFSAPSGATGPPIIAGGLVWVTNHSTGTLYGIDPSSGAATARFSIPEAGSEVNHFATPSAGGGRLFVGSGNQVTAFNIAQSPPPTATSTTLTASANPVPARAPVTLTATVAPQPDAGTVTFTDGGAAIPGCSAVALGAGAVASCQASWPAAGSHRVLATYSGDASYAGSASGQLVETVAASAAGGVRPVLSRVTISPRRTTARRGATLRLTLNERATVTVAITVLRRGHRTGRRCTLHAHRGRSCLVRVTLLRLRFRGRAGPNAFRLALRRLPPGHYTALVTAAGGTRAVRVTFTVVRSRR
jgi:outer membrane protein assembly factor BamB